MSEYEIEETTEGFTVTFPNAKGCRWQTSHRPDQALSEQLSRQNLPEGIITWPGLKHLELIKDDAPPGTITLYSAETSFWDRLKADLKAHSEAWNPWHLDTWNERPL